MQKTSLHELLFGGRGASNQYSLQVLGINGQERLCSRFSHSLVEVVNGYQSELLEAVAGLAALPLLAGNRGGQGFERLDVFPSKNAYSRLSPVDDYEAECLLVRQHLL